MQWPPESFAIFSGKIKTVGTLLKCKTFNKFYIWLSLPVWPNVIKKVLVTSDHDDDFPPNWWFTQSRLHPLQVQSANPRTSLQIARAPTTIVTIVNVKKQLSPKTRKHCHHYCQWQCSFHLHCSKHHHYCFQLCCACCCIHKWEKSTQIFKT